LLEEIEVKMKNMGDLNLKAENVREQCKEADAMEKKLKLWNANSS
jgi:hypothetical protein